MNKLVYILALLLVLTGCDEEKETKALVPTTSAQITTYQNSSGQYIEAILIKDMNNWLQANRNSEIIALTAVSTTGDRNNCTTGFIVVYKKTIQAEAK